MNKCTDTADFGRFAAVLGSGWSFEKPAADADEDGPLRVARGADLVRRDRVVGDNVVRLVEST